MKSTKKIINGTVALAFLAFGFCVSVPPIQAQNVQATFTENNPRSEFLIYLLEQKQPDGTWILRYTAPGSPMIFEELPGFHTYRVRARDLATGLYSDPSNEASITLYAPPNAPGQDFGLNLTDEPVNVTPAES